VENCRWERKEKGDLACEMEALLARKEVPEMNEGKISESQMR